MFHKISFILIILSVVCASTCNGSGIGMNLSLLYDSLDQQPQDSMSLLTSDKWIISAIKDIAYYLREHKFNEWDRRYYKEKPESHLIGFYSALPVPPLKSLHWEVKANCHSNFNNCIRYLHSIVQTAPFSRADDTAVLKNEKTNALNETYIQMHNHECEEKHKYAQNVGTPFDEPVEKFQWRTTATYYMCWYTMLGIPVLSMIEDCCDNFANCLDADFGSHNNDPRADDKLSFFCAMYSFCPDPCCPIQHIESINMCYKDKRNPCGLETTEGDSSKRKCIMERKKNQSLKEIMTNRWNITCNCKKGFQWKSDFSMCVDINECLIEKHHCNFTSQDCLNLPGSFYCVCKWDFELDEKRKICVKRNTKSNFL